MKRLSTLLGALLLSVTPGLAANNMASERLKGYNYGYIYGVGNILCALAIDKLVKKNMPKIYYLEQLRRTGAAIPTPHMQSGEVSMSSRFKQPSDIRRVQQLVITSLATLGTAVLFGLVNHGLVVIGAFV